MKITSEATSRRKERLPPPPLPPPPFMRGLSSSSAYEVGFRSGLDERPHSTAFLDPPPHISSRSIPGQARRRGPSATTMTDGNGFFRDGISKPSSLLSKKATRRGEKRRPQSLSSRTEMMIFDLMSLAKLQNFEIPFAVFLWYTVGVLSIATTKILLSEMHVKPLWLSVQQFALGGTFLHLLLESRLGSSAGKQPMPTFRSHSNAARRDSGASDPLMELILTALFFGFGFVVTNYSFNSGAASFVETVKASEPITSAIVAVTYGVDTVSPEEWLSLLGVVFGVLVSTAGSHLVHHTSASAESSHSTTSSVNTFFVVMIANLSFSFRGLHQKLLRSTNSGSSLVMDDMNLQYRMQWISASIFFLPALIFDVPGMMRHLLAISEPGIFFSGAFTQYIGLSIINGFAFATYNLASTYVLTRLTVVHHAALNCCRRIFAIVVTSIIFGVPLGTIGILGIIMSFVCFMSYTRFKVQRLNKPRPVSSLLPMSAV